MQRGPCPLAMMAVSDTAHLAACPVWSLLSPCLRVRPPCFCVGPWSGCGCPRPGPCCWVLAVRFVRLRPPVPAGPGFPVCGPPWFVRSPVPVRAVRFRPGLHGLAGGFHRGAQRLPWQVGDVSFCVTAPNLHSPPPPPFQRFHGLSDGPAARVCAANPKVRPPRSGQPTLPPLIRL